MVAGVRRQLFEGERVFGKAVVRYEAAARDKSVEILNVKGVNGSGEGSAGYVDNTNPRRLLIPPVTSGRNPFCPRAERGDDCSAVDFRNEVQELLNL